MSHEKAQCIIQVMCFNRPAIRANATNRLLQPEMEWNLVLSTGFWTEVFFPAAQPYSLWNISMTYYTSSCISRLCPLLYIAACAPGINHFPASLLREMKEFIMLTVAIARRSLWFIWEKLIDSLTQSEQFFAAGEPRRTLPNVAVCVQRTCLLYGGVYLASPVAEHRGSRVATSAHYLAGAVTDPEPRSSNLWRITERYWFRTSSNITGEVLIWLLM